MTPRTRTVTPQTVQASLIGKALLPAKTRDMMGDTLGSFSGLALDPREFSVTKGIASVRLFSLPDRGFNTPEKGEYADYPGRIHQLRLQFPISGASAHEPSLTYERSFYLRDEDGALTSGLDPGEGRKRQFGFWVPAINARISLDAEGLARRADGTFYVSDEFACAIYQVSADGQIQGMIAPPPSLLPTRRGQPHFTSQDDDPPKTGRQPNDGLEGLALSPDGRELWALMQSPLVQDVGKSAITQRYVRLLIYDVSGTPCPKKPNAHYLVELPLYDADGASRVAEVNCILPLGLGRFWVLTRDGGGWGDRKGPKGRPRPVRLKQIMEGRIEPDANLAGTQFELDTKSVLRKDALREGIRALPLHTAIDLCDETALNKIGLTKFEPTKNHLQISAKWESMCLSPSWTRAGKDRFLFVGNDNDFLTRQGFMPDGRYDAKLDNPNMILIYRVMMP